ncbi:DUF2946 family protein [Aquamicrobium defluvii]|uniref:DUF2946 family protein n=1 Tax=Aquamicrobium defluvii TaxID=69279 RepID=A0A011TDE7_9HYPH|nr:DUF2946 family protein [Aquamicrobium defluvii]EXL09689.1 hypothetical protein BG36_21560 [Aquamicrobium defluvii]EZQ16278.1 hypothetical protein CF98_40150 [Halopseudomonas bauzanensis]TDR36821.1 hypothetical protein DES43_104147 [Aquamicrobium defluvii]
MAVAFAAAWFLVLQSLLGAFAMAAGPERLQLDAFGNVICTHEGIGELPDGAQPAHFPDCCVLGCNLAAPLLANPPAPVALETGFGFATLSFRTGSQDHLSFARQRSPANPRAPPKTA